MRTLICLGLWMICVAEMSGAAPRPRPQTTGFIFSWRQPEFKRLHPLRHAIWNHDGTTTATQRILAAIDSASADVAQDYAGAVREKDSKRSARLRAALGALWLYGVEACHKSGASLGEGSEASFQAMMGKGGVRAVPRVGDDRTTVSLRRVLGAKIVDLAWIRDAAASFGDTPPPKMCYAAYCEGLGAAGRLLAKAVRHGPESVTWAEIREQFRTAGTHVSAAVSSLLPIVLAKAGSESAAVSALKTVPGLDTRKIQSALGNSARRNQFSRVLRALGRDKLADQMKRPAAVSATGLAK